MNRFILVLIFGNLVLVCNNAENDSFAGFNGLMAFFLVMYLIGRLADYIGETKDKALAKYKEHKNNKIAEDKYLDKLEKLAILKLQGALSDKEFEELKSKILRKM